MSKNLSPTRLNLTDLPRDPQGCLGGLRKALVASTNYCKRYPKKLQVLKATLKYVYGYIMECEKKAIAAQEAKEAADKALAEAEALVLKEAKEAADAKAALLELKKSQEDKE